MGLYEFLREKKIITTKGRIGVLEMLAHSNTSISADSIFEKSIEKGLSIDLSTIYRTLDLFEDKNIVDKYDLGEGKYSYKLKKIGHQHIIKCDHCQSEIKVDCPMNQIGELIKNKTGFTVTEHELTMKGICDKCSLKNKK